jgi:hypothetical protein
MALDPNACGSNLTFEEMFKSAIGTDSEGNPLLRMVNVADSGTDFYTCGTDKILNPAQLFQLDSNDKIALRVSIDGI